MRNLRLGKDMSFAQKYKDSEQQSVVLYPWILDSKSLFSFLYSFFLVEWYCSYYHYFCNLDFRDRLILLQASGFPGHSHWVSLGYTKLRKWVPQVLRKSLTLFQVIGGPAHPSQQDTAASACRRMKDRGWIKTGSPFALFLIRGTACLAHAPVKMLSVVVNDLSAKSPKESLYLRQLTLLLLRLWSITILAGWLRDLYRLIWQPPKGPQ